jgi:hypothetical protein
MHIALRAAGFSVMALFASCGVGAQQTDGLPTSNGSAQGIFRLDRPKPEVASGDWKIPLLNPVNSKQ